MKYSYVFSILLLFLICFGLVSLRYDEPANTNSEYIIGYNNIFAVDSKQLNANNISTWFRNNGSFNRDTTTGNSGFEWPKGSAKFARYASGLWIGAKVGNDTLVCVAEYDYEYLPGYVDNNGNPQGNNDPNYRIYRIDRGDTTSPDYQNWPINQGAYVNSAGRPFFLGTQTMFYSYTDAYAKAHNSNNGSTAPLKAQILQTNWCYTNIGLRDAAFTEFKVINRSNSVWINTFIAFWTDDDLGDASDDAIACDTIRDLGYTYNFLNNDPSYGAAPPAVGTTVLRSPIVPTGNNSDTVRYYHPPGSLNLKTKVGYKYIGLPIFNTYTNGDPGAGDPGNFRETYYVLQGLWRTGQSWLNPTTGQLTKKVYSGDPVTNTGWRMTSGGDRRFLQSFGPLNINPGDTQSIIIAQIIARGTNNLNSITLLRTLSDHVKMIYDQNFQSVLSVKNVSNKIPETFSLHQNYPNPFNPSTKIKFDIVKSSDTKLVIYDAIGRKLEELVDETVEPGTYEVEWPNRMNGSRNNYPSGIYFYKLITGDVAITKSMMLLK